jgi:hypothetical protein
VTAASHYHPDTLGNANAGQEWKVLTQEIAKLINGKYNMLKEAEGPVEID